LEEARDRIARQTSAVIGARRRTTSGEEKILKYAREANKGRANALFVLLNNFLMGKTLGGRTHRPSLEISERNYVHAARPG
jgi:hypothetical protein